MRKLFILSVVIIGAAAFIGLFAEGAERKVKVISHAGEVFVTRAGKDTPVKCRSGMDLRSGDRVRTGPDSYLGGAFIPAEESVVKIKENSDVVIVLKGDNKVDLVDGEIVTFIKRLGSGRTFRVVTPCAVCGARGTGWSAVTNGDITEVVVFENRVFVQGVAPDGSVMDEEFWIDRGNKRTVRKGEVPAEQEKVSEKKLQILVREMKLLLALRKRGGRKAGEREFLDEKRMDAMDSRLERAEYRLRREAGPAVMPLPGRGGGDDDDRRRTRPR